MMSHLRQPSSLVPLALLAFAAILPASPHTPPVTPDVAYDSQCHVNFNYPSAISSYDFFSPAGPYLYTNPSGSAYGSFSSSSQYCVLTSVSLRFPPEITVTAGLTSNTYGTISYRDSDLGRPLPYYPIAISGYFVVNGVDYLSGQTFSQLGQVFLYVQKEFLQ